MPSPMPSYNLQPLLYLSVPGTMRLASAHLESTSIPKKLPPKMTHI